MPSNNNYLMTITLGDVDKQSAEVYDYIAEIPSRHRKVAIRQLLAAGAFHTSPDTLPHVAVLTYGCVTKATRKVTSRISFSFHIPWETVIIDANQRLGARLFRAYAVYTALVGYNNIVLSATPGASTAHLNGVHTGRLVSPIPHRPDPQPRRPTTPARTAPVPDADTAPAAASSGPAAPEDSAQDAASHNDGAESATSTNPLFSLAAE